MQSVGGSHPALLGGDRGEGAAPRYLLIARKMGVPDAEEGGTAMYLDHLFIDQEGVPTLVEVKLP